MELFIEKRNTISQKFPLMFVVLRVQNKAQKVTVQDKNKSRKSETISFGDFAARFIPAK